MAAMDAAIPGTRATAARLPLRRPPTGRRLAGVCAGLAAHLENVHREVLSHLEKEEQVLFPAIQQLARDPQKSSPGGSLESPISVMMLEHDAAGELLSRLRSLTDGYTTPADGCASYHALYDGLAQFESDTHSHIHKENNRLFPMVVEMEQDLVSS